ncbi:MAG: LysM peptidoglycan-binding domain-containing protein [Acidimicrobiia bacterium]
MKRKMTRLGRATLVSLSTAVALGFVGVPGALADGKVSSSSSSSSAATSSLGLTYVVVKNDSLSRIATRVNVPIADLLVVNGFTRSSVIVPGQVIKLPDNASAVAATRTASVSASATYTVQRNDSLSLIASKHKVTLADLLSVNKFTRSSVIVPGQVINLPVGSNVTATPAVAPAPAATGTPGGSKVQAVVDFAVAQVGKPYVFNTAGPATFDCSGLTKASYATVGVKLPHQSLLQSKLGVAIDWKTTPIQAGDLIFTFSSANPTQISHVGIAISATQWVEAPNSGTVVRVSRIPSDARIQAVRRFL